MKENADSFFSITLLLKGNLPIRGLPFKRIKDAVLGKDYRLSLVIIGDARSKELNRAFRKKNVPTDILSFPLTEKSGEIFLNPVAAKREAVKFGRTEKNFLQFLFIHGLLHLEGLKHGSTMEREESKFRKRFGI